MRCSVCEKYKEGNLCPECGFDESCHYENFKTFAPVNSRAHSINALKNELDPFGGSNASAVRNSLCPVCGFDGSCDYENYMTFAPVKSKTEGFAGYKKAFVADSEEYKEILSEKQKLSDERNLFKSKYETRLKEAQKRLTDLTTERNTYKTKYESA